MRERFLKRKTRVCVFLVAILALLLWVPVRTALDVAAVQNAVQRDWEISFGYPLRSASDRPALLPATLDAEAYDLFFRVFAPSTRDEGPTKTRNRNIVAHERFRALFRGSIPEIHVYDFEAFHGDLGAALARFPKLQRVTVFTMEPDSPTESEWTLLCTRLRSLTHLEEIEIGGSWITDRVIAPLAGHPEIRTLSITYGRLTAESTKTFASMPRLSKLHIKDQKHEGEVWLSSANQAEMSASLPAVQIEFP